MDETIPIKSKPAAHVADVVLLVICRLGAMDTLITNHSHEFANKLNDRLYNKLNFDRHIASVYRKLMDYG